MYYFQIVGLIVGNQCVIRLVDFNGYFAALSFPQHSIVKFTMVHCIINNVLLGSPFLRPFPLSRFFPLIPLVCRFLSVSVGLLRWCVDCWSMRFRAYRFRVRIQEDAPTLAAACLLWVGLTDIYNHTHIRGTLLASFCLFRLCLNFGAIILCNNIKKITMKKTLDKISKCIILRATKTKRIKIF